MYAASLLTVVLLATTAFALPSSLADRATRRSSQRSQRRTKPVQVVDPTADIKEKQKDSTVSYSSNWAGPVYDRDNGTFYYVTGAFTVPTPSAPNGGDGSYAASAWVGIDGDTCDNAILQTGVDFTIDDGEVSYDAWYEWYPDYAYYFSGIDISAGDDIRLTVQASSTTEGTATIENLSNGQNVTQTLSSSYALCEQNAEWIVEDFEEGDSLVAFADFGTVEFTNAYARNTNNNLYFPSGADTIYEIVSDDDDVVTDVSTSNSSATITYG